MFINTTENTQASTTTFLIIPRPGHLHIYTLAITKFPAV